MSALLLSLLAATLQGLPDQGVLRLSGHTDGVRSVAWSPDGRRILTGSRDRTLILWDAATGERLRTFEGHDGGVTGAAFSPDGKLALSGSQDKSVILWEVETGKLLRRMKGHTLWVTCVACSPDGRHALSGSLDRSAILWDTSDGTPVMTIAGHADRIQGVGFSPDGKTMFTASADRTVQLWDATKEGRLDRFVADEAVTGAEFSPQGNRILAGVWNGVVQRWNRTGNEDAVAFKGHVGAVLAVSWSPDGLFYASSGRDGSVIIGDSATGRRLKRFFGHDAQVGSIAWSPSGRRLASAGEDGTVVIWEPWRPPGAIRQKWARDWAAMGPDARREALNGRLSGLKEAGVETLPELREWLTQSHEGLAAAMLDFFVPNLQGREPTLEQQRKIVIDLDSETPSTRAEARKTLESFGRGALPWIEAKLREANLSVEVKATLESVRQDLRTPAARVADDGRTRAVRLLLDLPRTPEIRDALRRYAEGPPESPATRIARPATGP